MNGKNRSAKKYLDVIYFTLKLFRMAAMQFHINKVVLDLQHLQRTCRHSQRESFSSDRNSNDVRIFRFECQWDNMGSYGQLIAT